MTQTEYNYLNSYNRELIFDLTLNAFTVYDFDHSDEDANAPRLHDYVPVGKIIKEDTDIEVLDNNGDVVVDASANTVTISRRTTVNRTRESRRENFKFLITQGTSITLAEFKDYDFKDYVTYDGTGFDFDSYLETGFDISQDFMRKKQAIYLLVYCKRTETIYSLVDGVVTPIRPSSCLVQSRWEWNDSTAQGKWGTQFQAYRLFLPQATSPSSGDAFDYGPTVIETKNKLRGSGKSLRLRFDAEAGKDLILLGWGLLGYKVDNP